MHPVRMLRHERIAIDGLVVHWHKAGEIINLPEPLALALIRDGIATDDLSPNASKDEEELPLAHQPKVRVRAIKKREYRDATQRKMVNSQ